MGRKPDSKTRELILKEAERLIHLRGFHQTSLDEIAKNCKMTKANLFHHFGSKEDLGLAVLDGKMADYRECRIDPLCGAGDPVEGVVKMFADCTRLYDGIGCKAGCFIGNIALEMSDLNEHFRKRVSLFFVEWTQGMAECFARAQKRGVFTKDLDTRAAAETILSLYEGAIMMARTSRDASVFLRVGRMAKKLLDQHKTSKEANTMGPKTPCGC